MASNINSESALKADGGGTGYDGKPGQFINRTGGPLCRDGSDIRSLIDVVSDDEAYVMRENCIDIASPIRVDKKDIGLMVHNPDNAIHADRAFDRLRSEVDPQNKDSLATKFLCRGTYENKNSKEIQAADVIIKYTESSNVAQTARVIMAVYSPAGVLLSVLDSGELKLRQIETGVENRFKFVTPIVGRHSITLWIEKSGQNRLGKLSFIDLPYPGRENEPNYNYRDYERVIQNLNCYGQ